MPHRPRDQKKFKTQRQAMDKVILDIRRVVSELGTSPDELMIEQADAQAYLGNETKKKVYFSVKFKLYFWPDTDHYMLIQKHVDWLPRAIDCGAAIYEWLHNRLMSFVNGVETLDEAFAANMVYTQSKLPPAVEKRLLKGPNAPFPMEKMLPSGEKPLRLPGESIDVK